MNLVFLLSAQHPGGGTLTFFRFASSLADRGHEVTLVYDYEWIGSVAPSPSLKTELRLQLLNESAFRGAGRINRICRSAWDLIRGKSVLKNADWIIGEQAVDAIRAIRLARHYRTRSCIFVYESTGMIREAQRYFDSGDQLTRRVERQRALFDRALPDADVIIPNSLHTKARCIQEIPVLRDRLSHPVHPGIGPPSFTVDRVTRHGGPCWVYIGRLVRSKGIAFLLDLLSELASPPLLRVIGTGPELTSLQSTVRRLGLNVQFNEWLSEEEKWRVLADTSLLLFPTVLEGFGIPPGEALLAGVPCVASDIPVLRSVYGDHLFYADPLNRRAWKRTIERVKSHSAETERAVSDGCLFIRAHYTWDISVALLERTLQGLPVSTDLLSHDSKTVSDQVRA